MTRLDGQLCLFTRRHLGDAHVPSFDDAADTDLERERSVEVLAACVEDGAIHEPSSVVRRNALPWQRKSLAVARLNGLDLNRHEWQSQSRLHCGGLDAMGRDECRQHRAPAAWRLRLATSSPGGVFQKRVLLYEKGPYMVPDVIIPRLQVRRLWGEESGHLQKALIPTSSNAAGSARDPERLR